MFLLKQSKFAREYQVGGANRMVLESSMSQNVFFWSRVGPPLGINQPIVQMLQIF